MAGLRDLIKKETNRNAEARELAKPLEKDFPFVAELLGGIAAKGQSPEVPPSTITFFFHEGKIRFSTNVKGLGKTLIGDVADVTNPWGSINTALAMGECSQKDYTERNGKMTAEQEKLLL